MCGIAGVLDPTGALSSEALHHMARAMGEALAHRGPDDHGTWADGRAGIALAHRRLSVIDLSAEGHQPMLSASGRYAITYNGEIYNYVAIRRELEAIGAAPAWRGHSDTEAMLAAFERWGVADALQRFNGMFAYALWDRQDRVLHLARDRMGEKPLYYCVMRGRFAFGSELAALRAVPSFRGEIDRDALALLLRYNYVPAPWSIYRDVRKLRPGERAEIRCDDEGAPNVRTCSYWSVAEVARRGIALPGPLDEREAADRVRAELDRSVCLRMVGDVPVGAFLSGGIDSTLVTATMQRLSSQRVRTFTIGFGEREYDEAPWARRVASHLGTDHTEHYVTDAEARAVVPLLPTMYGEPFADSSQIPTFLVSKLARGSVTVALTGDGGDELFCGYERYVRNLLIERMPAFVRRTAASTLRALPAHCAAKAASTLQAVLPRRHRFTHASGRLRKLGTALGHANPRQRYLSLVSLWNDGLPLAGPREVTGPPEHFAAEDPDLAVAPWMMLSDQRSYLPDDVLAKVDRASMSIALETRLPLLDHELVACAWSIPDALKLRNGHGKHLLRVLLTLDVPAELVERPKRGFAVPLGAWLRGPLREWAEALLDDTRLKCDGFLDADRVRRRWHATLADSSRSPEEIWGVLMFQSWLEAERAR